MIQLWDVMSGEEAVQLIENGNDAEAMARTLLSRALDRPKCTDNITIIVVIF